MNAVNKKGTTEVGMNYKNRHLGAQFNFTNHDNETVQKDLSPCKKKALAHPGIVNNPWKSSLGYNFL